jgi:acyl carrier protein
MEPRERLSKAEILRRVQLMMKELFGLDSVRVQPDTRLVEDLELDSLDAIDLAVKVEETTGFAFDEARLRELRTIGDVIVAIEFLANEHEIPALRSLAPAQTDQ